MTDYNIKNLVFEGGGVKGIAYGGALYELDKLNILNNIKRVTGISAGAITAVLLATGYNYSEIMDILKNINYNNFEDDDIGVLKDIKRFFSDFGWYKGDFLKNWIGELIFEKQGKKDLTFEELHNAPNSLEL